MSDNEFHYVTVTNLHERTYTTYYGKGEGYSSSHSVSAPFFSGDMFFDSELVTNRKSKHNYREGMLIGRIGFSLGDSADDFQSFIHVTRTHLIHEHHIDEVSFSVSCHTKLFDDLRKASLINSAIRIGFKIGEWTSDDDEFTSKCRIDNLVITNTKYDSEFFEDKKVRHIQNYLITELCGGQTYSQIPTICMELSKAFSSDFVFNKRKDLLSEIVQLINSIKWMFELEKSSLRKKIECSEDIDLSKLFSLYGDEFYEQLSKIEDTKDKNDILVEYNNFWKRVDALSMFTHGYKWNGSQFPSIADDYLKIPYINSPTLNSILVDGLICKDIADTASSFQYNKLMSPEAILSLSNGVYVKNQINVKNKTIFHATLMGLANSFGEFFSLVLVAIIIWGVTSLISGNNELAHYIIFSALLSSSIIVTAIGKSKSEEAIRNDIEQEKFYLLRNMCHLHKQSEFMNSSLIFQLMYKIEEKGVAFNHSIYDVLKRHCS